MEMVFSFNDPAKSAIIAGCLQVGGAGYDFEGKWKDKDCLHTTQESMLAVLTLNWRHC